MSDPGRGSREVHRVADDKEEGKDWPLQVLPAQGPGSDVQRAAMGIVCELRPLRPSPQCGAPTPCLTAPHRSPKALPKARYSGLRKVERSAQLETVGRTQGGDYRRGQSSA